MKVVSRVFAASALVASMAVVSAAALADGDSSADASNGFAQSVEESEAVIIRVPVNAQGAEMTDAAEMVLHHGADLGTSGDLVAAFAAGQDAGEQPEVDVNSDSSTSRYSYGWNRWRNYGYYNYYYRNYTPTYYYYGGSWSYNYGYYRNYNNYRYYYYRRCW